MQDMTQLSRNQFGDYHHDDNEHKGVQKARY